MIIESLKVATCTKCYKQRFWPIEKCVNDIVNYLHKVERWHFYNFGVSLCKDCHEKYPASSDKLKECQYNE